MSDWVKRAASRVERTDRERLERAAPVAERVAEHLGEPSDLGREAALLALHVSNPGLARVAAAMANRPGASTRERVERFAEVVAQGRAEARALVLSALPAEPVAAPVEVEPEPEPEPVAPVVEPVPIDAEEAASLPAEPVAAVAAPRRRKAKRTT